MYGRKSRLFLLNDLMVSKTKKKLFLSISESVVIISSLTIQSEKLNVLIAFARKTGQISIKSNCNLKEKKYIL